MFDYKLILILVLSIVLLILYNRVEDLKSDITDIKYLIEDDKKKNANKCKLNTNSIKSLPKIILPQNFNNKLFVPKDILKKESDINNQNNHLSELITKKIEKELKQQLESENTQSFNATEKTDSISIDYEQSSNEIAIYSNEHEKISSENKINVNIDSILKEYNESDILISDNHPAIVIAKSLMDINNKPDNLIEQMYNYSNENIIIIDDNNKLLFIKKLIFLYPDVCGMLQVSKILAMINDSSITEPKIAFLSWSAKDSKKTFDNSGSFIEIQLDDDCFVNSISTIFCKNFCSKPSAPAPKNSLSTLSNLLKFLIA